MDVIQEFREIYKNNTKISIIHDGTIYTIKNQRFNYDKGMFYVSYIKDYKLAYKSIYTYLNYVHIITARSRWNHIKCIVKLLYLYTKVRNK